MKKRINLTLIISICLLFFGCHTPKVGYFADLEDSQTEKIRQVIDISIRPDDKLSIVVNSRDPQLSALFNLPYTAQRIGGISSTRPESNLTLMNNQGILCYTVDRNGDIDFPILGKIHVEGMKRDEIASYIKQSLLKRNLIKDPVVTVDYAGLYFNVLGEVNKPGRYAFDRDHFTLLDAIGMAGDLTINGQRENITVIREEGNLRTSYKVNLLSGQSLYESPVYYLRQNDVIYVEPNVYRARQSTVNDNTIRSTSFWISVVSLLTTVAVLIFK